MTPTAIRALEYDKLKDEQRDRIRARNNLMYTTLGALAVLGWAAEQGHNLHLLLAVPALLVVMSWWFLDEDRKITGLRRHFQTLGRDLDVETGNTGPRLLGWELPSDGEGRRTWGRAGRFGVHLGLFVAPGLAALVVWSATAGRGAAGVLQAGWVAGLLVMLLLVVAFVTNAVGRIDRPSRQG